MDVKSSWRRALEEDEAEKRGRSMKSVDPIMERQTPHKEPSIVLLSPDSSPSAPNSDNLKAATQSPPVSQQGLRTTLLWDTVETEGLNTPSGTGSSAVQFSLAQETLPEMPSCDSLLSLDEEALDSKSEDDDDLLLPSLKTEGKCPPLNALHHLGQFQRTGDDGSFMESRRAPECLLTGPTFDKDWLMTPAKSNETTDKVFSLDLDSLDTPTHPKKQDFSLPKLITFSPIDDMKC